MLRQKRLLVTFLICLLTLAVSISSALIFVNRQNVKADTTYELLFDTSCDDYDYASWPAGWWSGSSTTINQVGDGGDAVYVERGKSDISAYYCNATYTTVTSGKTYVVTFKLKAPDESIYVNACIVDPWTVLNSGWVNQGNDYSVYYTEFKATTTGALNIGFQITGGTGKLYINDYKMFEKVSTTLNQNDAIGTLPTIPTKAGYTGVWKIDSTIISSDTLYAYTENKVATINYLASYTLTYNTNASTDLISSTAGWWSQSGGNNGHTFSDNISTVNFTSSGANGIIYYLNSGAFNSVSGKTYAISIDYKLVSGSGYFHIFQDNVAWNLIKDNIHATSEWQTYTTTFTGYANGEVLILQDPNADSVIQFKNLIISEPNTINVYGGEPIGTLPEIPAKAGYIGSWQIDRSNVDASTIYNYGANKTLTLNYVLNQYTLTFNNENNEFVSSSLVTGGTQIGTLPEVPEKAGYTGVWEIDGVEISSSSTYNYGANKTALPSYTANAYKLTYTASETADLISSTAGWWSGSAGNNGHTFSDNISTVNFTSTGASGIIYYLNTGAFNSVSGKTYTISIDYKIVSGGGYFHIWQSPTAWGLIKDNILSTSEWQTYTTTFTACENGVTLMIQDPNSNSTIQFKNMIISEKTVYDVTYGLALSMLPEVPEKAGYTGSWQIDGVDVTSSTIYNYSSNKALKLNYVIDGYTLTFNDENSVLVQNVVVAPNSAIGELPEVPEKAGYTGVWKIDGVEITSATIYTYGANKTAIPSYTAKTYSIYYVSGTDYDASSEIGNWWDGGVTSKDGVVQATRASSNINVYCSNATFMTLTSGKTYYVTFKLKTSANIYIAFSINNQWQNLLSSWVNNADYVTYTYEFNAVASEQYSFIYQLNAGSGTIYIDDFKVFEKIDSNSVTYKSAIGELPTIPEKTNYSSKWTIGGNEITSSTIYSYTENMFAFADYYLNSYTLTFVNEKYENDFASSVTGWTDGLVTCADNTITMTRTDTNVNVYYTLGGNTEVVSGKTYVVSLSIKTTTNMYINFAVNDPWYTFISSWVNNSGFVDYTFNYTATTTGLIAFIFQINNGNGNVLVNDFKMYEVVQTSNVTLGTAIGTLPTIPSKEDCLSCWKIDGVEVTSASVYNYTSNKICYIHYTELEHYTLSFDMSNSAEDLASSATKWWVEAGSEFTCSDGVVSASRNGSNLVLYVGSAKNTTLTSGKTYYFTFKIKTTGNIYIALQVADPWSLVNGSWYNCDDFTTYTYEYTATVTQQTNFYFSLNSGDYTINLKDVKVYEKVDSRKVYVGDELGTLPEIPSKDGYNGYWKIDGTTVLYANTVCNFTKNKTAVVVYYPIQEITSASLNVGNTFDINFYVTCFDVDDEDISFRVTHNGVARVYTLSDSNVAKTGNEIRFTYGNIAPQNIRDILHVEFLIEKVVIDDVYYSVYDYCINKMSSGSDNLIALVKDILVYGGATQDYLVEQGKYTITSENNIDVDGNNVAIVGTTFNGSSITSVTNLVTDTDGYDSSYYFNGKGINVGRSNFINVRFVATGDFKIFVNDEDFTSKATKLDSNTYKVSTNDISPLHFADSYVFRLYALVTENVDDGSGNMVEQSSTVLVQTLTYSVNSFIYAKKDGSDALANLVKALYNYSTTVYDYFYDSSFTIIQDFMGTETENELSYHNIIIDEASGLDIGTDNYIYLRFKQTDIDVIGTIEYKVTGGSASNSESFYIEKGTTEFYMFLDVYRTGAVFGNYKDASKTITRIIFRNVDGSEADGHFTLLQLGHSPRNLLSDVDDNKVVYLSDGELTIGFNLDAGGGITYLSKTGVNEYIIYTTRSKKWYQQTYTYGGAVRYIGNDPTKCESYNPEYGTDGYKLVSTSGVNLLNIYDKGREIQQSYYAVTNNGSGSTSSYYNGYTGETENYVDKDWAQNNGKQYYNPVQCGDMVGNSSQIIDYKTGVDDLDNPYIYIKTRSLDWGDANYSNQLTWSYSENTYTIKNGMVYVDNRFIDWRLFDEFYTASVTQEIPAIYIASSLGTYYAEVSNTITVKDSDMGNMSTTNINYGYNSYSAGTYHYAIEGQYNTSMNWFAWLNKEDFGVAMYFDNPGKSIIYTAGKDSYAGNSGDGSNCYDNSYCYSSVAYRGTMKEQTALEYTYVLCVDTLTNIKTSFNDLSSDDSVDNSSLKTAWAD